MFGVQFNHAAYLGLLVPLVPLTAALWYASVRATITARRAYSEERLLDRFGRRFSARSQVISLAAWCLATALLVVAASGPTANHAPQHAAAGSLQVVITFDVSKSVGAEDYKNSIPKQYRDRYYGAHGTRLDKAKQVVQAQIMPAVSGNQVGFVTYKGDGFPQAELTDDYAALNWVLENWVRIGNAPGGGSDYARGLLEAVRMFHRTPHDANVQRVIVMFSDGGFTGDRAMLADVMALLKRENIRLVVLGLGLSHNAPVPEYNEYTGDFVGYYKVDGKNATSSIDESALRMLASQGSGEYHHVTADGVNGINWPSALRGRDKVTDERQDMFQYPLGLAFAIIAGLTLLGRRKRHGR
jgi:hypothetical protein